MAVSILDEFGYVFAEAESALGSGVGPGARPVQHASNAFSAFYHIGRKHAPNIGMMYSVCFVEVREGQDLPKEGNRLLTDRVGVSFKGKEPSSLTSLVLQRKCSDQKLH